MSLCTLCLQAGFMADLGAGAFVADLGTSRFVADLARKYPCTQRVSNEHGQRAQCELVFVSVPGSLCGPGSM